MTTKTLITLCAFRYALGRRSYIVPVVADYIKKAHLPVLARELIVREIDQANSLRRGLPDYAHKSWDDLRTFLLDQLQAEALELKKRMERYAHSNQRKESSKEK